MEEERPDKKTNRKIKLRNPFKNLTKFEWALWICSLAAVIISFFSVKNTDYWTLVTSLIGVTSLIFAAKGDAFGIMVMLAFCIVYAIVSFTFGYYGEMIIYLCMHLPTSIATLVSWLKHPGEKGSAEVKVGKLTPIYGVIMAIATAAVTTAFYFILRALNTENLIVSTVSVGTSFAALYLMVFRVPAYSAAFMLNDIVLIILWSIACSESLNYLPMVVCFAVFLINDLYGFINWSKRKKRQLQEEQQTTSQTED